MIVIHVTIIYIIISIILRRRRWYASDILYVNNIIAVVLRHDLAGSKKESDYLADRLLDWALAPYGPHRFPDVAPIIQRP